MTSVSAGHIIVPTPSQPVGSGRPERELAELPRFPLRHQLGQIQILFYFYLDLDLFWLKLVIYQ